MSVTHYPGAKLVEIYENEVRGFELSWYASPTPWTLKTTGEACPPRDDWKAPQAYEWYVVVRPGGGGWPRAEHLSTFGVECVTWPTPLLPSTCRNGNWKIGQLQGAGQLDPEGWEYATKASRMGPHRVPRIQVVDGRRGYTHPTSRRQHPNTATQSTRTRTQRPEGTAASPDLDSICAPTTHSRPRA